MSKIMKYKKEITVAVLAIIALFLLYFGFNFLKGVNIFNKTNSYVVKYEKMNGLVEQGPVYVKGYKVGQVDHIVYDFTQSKSFTVEFSVNEDIRLPFGTEVALVPDGLISGEALELMIPTDSIAGWYNPGDTLESSITPGMLNAVAEAVMSQLSPILASLDTVMNALQKSISEKQLQNIMTNVQGTMDHVNSVAQKADVMMAGRIPMLVDSVQLAVNDLHKITDNLSQTDLKATVARVDNAVDEVNTLVKSVNSGEGTIGLLFNDKKLYQDINHTVNSADSLITDIKAHPKRYVQISVFGKKEK